MRPLPDGPYRPAVRHFLSGTESRCRIPGSGLLVSTCLRFTRWQSLPLKAAARQRFSDSSLRSVPTARPAPADWDGGGACDFPDIEVVVVGEHGFVPHHTSALHLLQQRIDGHHGIEHHGLADGHDAQRGQSGGVELFECLRGIRQEISLSLNFPAPSSPWHPPLSLRTACRRRVQERANGQGRWRTGRSR